ncbi:MAG: hypothetical protein PHX20_02045 [Candidatus Omnitrophica bacterium]|nr:hypothetical protein [Candidatus Omnitrophota bacterium]MDD5436303.1 hypothetical protein [Candidatus Omnitrophota bacterium]
MIRRIIFLTESPFDLRDYRRFGFELLRENQFAVETWDATPALHPDIHAAYSPPDKMEDEGLVTFRDPPELYDRLSSLRSDDFVINLINYRFKMLDVYKALGRSRADYAVSMANTLPYVASVRTPSLFEKVKGLFPITRESVALRIFVRAPFKFFGVKPAKIILAGGENCLGCHYPADQGTEALWAHALDYDIYRKERETTPSGDSNTIVFLDEYLPFHPDWKYYNSTFPMRADEYYGLLDKLFCKLEGELKKEVVIAAHPRSKYSENDGYFKSRKCIKGETCALVRDSDLVVSHISTSINFANLFYKPVLFVTSQHIDKCWEGPLIRTVARWFGKDPVFMDEDISVDMQELMKVDRQRYDNYRRSYIKRDGSPDLDFWQIVADRLKSL